MNQLIPFSRSRIRRQLLLLMLLVPLMSWASSPLPPSVADVKAPAAISDADSDGIPDTNDLCPNTPAGTAVNAYGCSLSRTSCDFMTASITLTSAGGSGGGTLRYVLADSVGQIIQVSTGPTFSGLTGSRTYMALSIIHDGSVANLTAGQSLSSVTASCFDWSDALLVRVCVTQPPGGGGCDYSLGTPITLTSTGGSTTAGTLTRYVLVNSAGIIVQVTSGPTFTTTGFPAGSYSAYSLVYTDDQSLRNLQTNSALALVQSSCLSLSTPLTLTLCSAKCIVRCVPFVIQRIR